jgi:hypothetical protein
MDAGCNRAGNMAIAPSSSILASDMNALAVMANVNGRLPKTNSQSGIPYNEIYYPSIVVAGINYSIGDTVSLDTGGSPALFNVAAISSAGGIIGIRIVSRGYWDPSSNPASPAALSGGTGSGARITFSYGTVGTDVPYSFPNYSNTAANIAGIYLVSGGTDYTNGDVLNLSVGGIEITVTGTASGGIITTWTINNPGILAAIHDPLGERIASVSGGSGSDAIFGLYFTLLPNMGWATELSRLRTNAQTQFGITYERYKQFGSTFASHFSGPWPIYNPGDNYQNLAFYYADSGNVETVTVSGPTHFPFIFCQGPFDMVLNEDGTPIITAMTCSFIIGGNVPAELTGDFYIIFDIKGSYSGPFIDTDLGIGTSAIYINPPANPFGYAYVVWHVDHVTVNPGQRFSIKVSGSYTDKDNYCQLVYSGGGVFSADSLNQYPSGESTGIGPSISQSFTARIAVPGIHNSKQIWKVPVGYYAPGIISCYTPVINYDNVTPPYPAPIFGPEQQFNSGGTNYSTTVPGLWTANTLPVSDLNPITYDLMPWNLGRSFHGSADYWYNPMFGVPVVGLLNGGAYAFPRRSRAWSTPIELQNEPPRWSSYTWFDYGDIIMDSNGNFQMATTVGGNPSGAVEPVWGTSAGSTIQETYNKFAGQPPVKGIAWTLTSTPQPTITSAPHRLLGLPRYPVYWGRNNLATTWQPGLLWQLPNSCIDSNGNTQSLVTPGFSGATTPNWATALNGITADGSCEWKLTKLGAETISRLKPPVTGSDSEITIWGAGSQWQNHINGTGNYDPGWQQSNLAYGWWIHSVSLNRLGIPDANGISVPQSTQLFVGLGCIRNGAFVSFGTYATGTSVQVLWPVFTSDALVYQCSERIDVQALAIYIPNLGAGVHYPIAAANYIDAETLVGAI